MLTCKKYSHAKLAVGVACLLTAHGCAYSYSVRGGARHNDEPGIKTDVQPPAIERSSELTAHPPAWASTIVFSIDDGFSELEDPHLVTRALAGLGYGWQVEEGEPRPDDPSTLHLEFKVQERDTTGGLYALYPFMVLTVGLLPAFRTSIVEVQVTARRGGRELGEFVALTVDETEAMHILPIFFVFGMRTKAAFRRALWADVVLNTIEHLFAVVCEEPGACRAR